jgi:hypothetical protein
VAPPGLPPARAAALRQAFVASLKDPALLADAKKNDMEITPVSAEDIEVLLTRVANLPKAVIERTKEAMGR